MSTNELLKSQKSIKSISPLLINERKNMKLNKSQSMKNLQKGKRSKLNTISEKNKNKLINLLTTDFNENHLKSMLKNNQLIPFEEYNKKVEKNFLDYKIVDTSGKNIIRKKNIKKYEEEDENNFYNKEKDETNDSNKVKSGIKLLRNNSLNYYKISVNGFNFYNNPNESLTAINNNNEIFNEINKDCLARQRILFEKNIKAIESLNMKSNFQSIFKMPKVKIFNSSSKIRADIPVINLINENYKNEDDAFPKLSKIDEELELFSFFIYPSKNFPEGKEQFSLCTKGKYLYLSGGLSTNMKQLSIWSLNMETLEWNKILLKNTTYSRFGHTSIYYQNKIYFFGGTLKIEKSSLLTNLEIFSFHDKSFVVSNSKGGPCKRKNHIAELIGNTMLIHGGLDEEEQILDDCYILNLLTLKWFIPVINSNTPHPKVYGHSSCLVVPNSVLTNGAFSVYKIPDVDYISKKGKKNIQKGLYIFGGKTKEINGLTNNLWILLLGQTPLQWIKPETKGIQPSPRYYHSMNFYEKSRYIIIHGGRNDNLSSSCALDDTFILELVNLNWIKIKLYSNNDNFKVISRFGHNSSIFDNKLIIFGGMNNNNYIGSSLFIVNLDFNFSPKIMNEAEQLMINNSKNSKIDEIKKQEMNDKLGIISQFILPPIK